MAQVIDTKILGKAVKEFDCDEAKWTAWSFKFENYCGAISAEMLQLMEAAKHENDVIQLSGFPEHGPDSH